MTLCHCTANPNVHVANQKQILNGKVFVNSTSNTDNLIKYSNTNGKTLMFYCINLNVNMKFPNYCIRIHSNTNTEYEYPIPDS